MALRWVPLTATMALMWLADALVATVIRVNDDVVAAPMIGAFYAQIVVAAVATAWAPWNAAARVLIGTALMAYSTACLFVVGQRDGGGDAGFVFGGAMIGQWIIYQIPLWIARVQGWRLSMEHQVVGGTDRSESQFGIRHILIWTAIVGVFLAVVRAVSPALSEVESVGGRQEIFLFTLMTLGNSLLVLPLMWGAFVRRNMPQWLAGGILWAGLVTVVQVWLVSRGPGQPHFIVLINIVQVVAAGLVLLMLRLPGYRIGHHSQSPASPFDE